MSGIFLFSVPLLGYLYKGRIYRYSDKEILIRLEENTPLAVYCLAPLAFCETVRAAAGEFFGKPVSVGAGSAKRCIG